MFTKQLLDGYIYPVTQKTVFFAWRKQKHWWMFSKEQPYEWKEKKQEDEPVRNHLESEGRKRIINCGREGRLTSIWRLEGIILKDRGAEGDQWGWKPDPLWSRTKGLWREVSKHLEAVVGAAGLTMCHSPAWFPTHLLVEILPPCFSSPRPVSLATAGNLHQAQRQNAWAKKERPRTAVPLLPENWATLPQRSGRKTLMKTAKQSLKVSWKMRTRELPLLTALYGTWNKKIKQRPQ